MALIQTYSRRRKRFPFGPLLFLIAIIAIIALFISFGLGDTEVEQKEVTQTITYKDLQSFKQQQ